MPRIELKFEVNVQELHLTNPVRLIAGSRNYYFATFAVDSTWADIESAKAVFVRNGASWVMPLAMGVDEFECQVPWEVMENGGRFGVGVFGGDRLLTNLVVLNVEDSFLSEGEESLAPTPDWFSKVSALIAGLENIEDITALGQTVAEIASKKVSLPTVNDKPSNGVAGQFAVSDGKGGIAWKTLVNVYEEGA